jgi:hypothetical protein
MDTSPRKEDTGPGVGQDPDLDQDREVQGIAGKNNLPIISITQSAHI